MQACEQITWHWFVWIAFVFLCYQYHFFPWNKAINEIKSSSKSHLNVWPVQQSVWIRGCKYWSPKKLNGTKMEHQKNQVITITWPSGNVHLQEIISKQIWITNLCTKLSTGHLKPPHSPIGGYPGLSLHFTEMQWKSCLAGKKFRKNFHPLYIKPIHSIELLQEFFHTEVKVTCFSFCLGFLLFLVECIINTSSKADHCLGRLWHCNTPDNVW